MKFAASILLMCCATAASAFQLDLAAPATLTREDVTTATQVDLPRAPFDGATVPRRAVLGTVMRRAWQIPAGGMTTQQMFEPLKAQVQSNGYGVVFECRDAVCGGYDFRFAANILDEPAMHVDLGDFVYLLAEAETGDVVTLMVSRSTESGFVQMLHVSTTPPRAAARIVKSSKGLRSPLPQPSDTAMAELVKSGHVPLDDLQFGTGSSQLEGDDYDSLSALAAFLAEDRSRRVTLVGHTDAEGTLDGNIALSRRRAGAVRTMLVRDHGADPTQLSAEGIGFLAPRASNGSDDGRRANRRVEVILTQ